MAYETGWPPDDGCPNGSASPGVGTDGSITHTLAARHDAGSRRARPGMCVHVRASDGRFSTRTTFFRQPLQPDRRVGFRTVCSSTASKRLTQSWGSLPAASSVAIESGNRVEPTDSLRRCSASVSDDRGRGCGAATSAERSHSWRGSSTVRAEERDELCLAIVHQIESSDHGNRRHRDLGYLHTFRWGQAASTLA